jgi:hypothetical protein
MVRFLLASEYMRAHRATILIAFSVTAFGATDKPSPWAQQAPARHEIFIPKGTTLRVRINQAVDTRRNPAGTKFQASLAQPLVHDGATVLPRGTRFIGHVVESKPSGRLKGRAVLSLTLDSILWNGTEHRISTGDATRVSSRHKKRDLVLIGGGAGTGASIGAIAGGGLGAVVGAAAGSVAGTATALVTGKKNVYLSPETVVAFPVWSPVRL